MASTNPPLATCTVCAKLATTHCAGCVSEEITKNLGHHTPRLYCGKECQRSDWESHKKPCNLVQAQAKLFRAGDILKEVFLATRAEALDLHLAKVECSGDDEIQIYDSAEASSFDKVGPLLVTLPDDEKVKHAVLSYRAGVDALAGVMDALGKQLLNGYSAKVEEVHLRVFAAKVKVHRHRSEHTAGTPLLENQHVVLCVTLKDGSAWAVDLAGAQHGQDTPVLRFPDYSRDYIASVAARCPHGTATKYSLPHSNFQVRTVLADNRDYQGNELDEWVMANVAVKNLLKAKPAEYERLKNSLSTHLATAASEYIKLTYGDPTSKLRFFVDRKKDFEELSQEDKIIVEKKRASILAQVERDPLTRELYRRSEGKDGRIKFIIRKPGASNQI